MAKIDEGTMSLSYNYLIKDKNGKTLKKSRELRSHSFVKQFNQFLFYCSSGNYNQTMYDTTNTLRTFQRWMGVNLTVAFGIHTGGGDSNSGLVVGTGTNAVTINDYNLQTKVVEGSGSGQLQHSSMVYGAPTTNATGSAFRITRDFTNNSGGNITLNEIGIIAYGYDDSSTYRYFLFIRDILSPSITVNNLTTLTINYNMKTTI